MLSLTDHLDHTNEILIVSTYYAMSNKLDEMRRQGEWPISSYRLCKFFIKKKYWAGFGNIQVLYFIIHQLKFDNHEKECHKIEMLFVFKSKWIP